MQGVVSRSGSVNVVLIPMSGQEGLGCPVLTPSPGPSSTSDGGHWSRRGAVVVGREPLIGVTPGGQGRGDVWCAPRDACD